MGTPDVTVEKFAAQQHALFNDSLAEEDKEWAEKLTERGADLLAGGEPARGYVIIERLMRIVFPWWKMRTGSPARTSSNPSGGRTLALSIVGKCGSPGLPVLSQTQFMSNV